MKRVFTGAAAPKCEFCGRFTRDYTVIQPQTELWKLEPNDPVLVCRRCANHTESALDTPNKADQ